MAGFWGKLGSFASKIFSTIRETGISVAEAVGLFKPEQPTLTVAEAEREYGKVSVGLGQKDILAQVDEHALIPLSLHDPAPLNFKRVFTYTVSMYGRGVAGRADGKGGQFVHDEFYITTSRQMTPAEVLALANERFGKGGAYAMTDIFSANLTQAYVRHAA